MGDVHPEGDPVQVLARPVWPVLTLAAGLVERVDLVRNPDEPGTVTV